MVYILPVAQIKKNHICFFNQRAVVTVAVVVEGVLLDGLHAVTGKYAQSWRY